MSARLNYAQLAPDLFKKFAGFGAAVKQGSSIEATIAHLVDIRASQLNGCAFCLDMHVKEAKIDGERERAALEWTEALTQLSPHGVPDAAYAQARAEFSEKELVELTFMIMVINGWNRINCAFRGEPGTLDKMMGLDKAGLK